MRYHRSLAQSREQQILVAERHLVGALRCERVCFGFGDPLRIDVDSHAARAIMPCCGDRNSTIARSALINPIGRPAAAPLQPLVNPTLGSGIVSTETAHGTVTGKVRADR